MRNEEELLTSSIEYMSTCLKSLSDIHELQNIENELQGVQKEIKEVQVEIAQMKANPETNAGSSSERIQKYHSIYLLACIKDKMINIFFLLFRLETEVNKFCGRYDFTRFLTQLLLMASEEDLNHPKIADLFLKCGEAVD